jgi:hypothetical protein
VDKKSLIESLEALVKSDSTIDRSIITKVELAPEAVLASLVKTEEHKVGMVVPKGGSNCAKCEYLAADKEHCSNLTWIGWWSKKSGHDTSLIPAPIDEYCCDGFDWSGSKLKK